MYIGTQLRKLRDKRHLSQQEIADQLNVAQTTVWNWENDESHFKLDHLPKLAEILQVDPADLLPEGSVVKIVNNKENKDNSVNAFEVKMDERVLSEKLLKSLEETIALLKEQNQVLREENALLKTHKASKP
jgi:transcriptional regulator with XRE-family HTH domain